MDPCTLTATITALANLLAKGLSDDELNLLGVTLTQLADTLLTIAAYRSACCPEPEANAPPPAKPVNFSRSNS